jgi:hypothetical protein
LGDTYRPGAVGPPLGVVNTDTLASLQPQSSLWRRRRERGACDSARRLAVVRVALAHAVRYHRFIVPRQTKRRRPSSVMTGGLIGRCDGARPNRGDRYTWIASI